MNRILLSILLLVTSLFVFAPQVSATEIFPECKSGNAVNTEVCQEVNKQDSSNNNPILSILKKVIAILGIIIGVASVIVLMVAGLTFIVNGSDPQAVARARNMIIYAVIGIVIAVMAESIVVFILRATH